MTKYLALMIELEHQRPVRAEVGGFKPRNRRIFIGKSGSRRENSRASVAENFSRESSRCGPSESYERVHDATGSGTYRKKETEPIP